MDDQAKGGDIDVYIEPELVSVDEIVEAKINALVELLLELGEQKIDLVMNRRKGLDLPIYRAAKQQGGCCEQGCLFKPAAPWFE